MDPVQFVTVLFIAWPTALICFIIYWVFRQKTSIHVYMIRSNRFSHNKQVGKGADKFDFDQGTYLIVPSAVNLRADLDTGIIDPRPELVYLEHDPSPVVLNKIQTPDGHYDLLDQTLIRNALSQVGGVKPLALGKILGKLGGIGPGTFLIFVIGIIILVSFMSEMIAGP